MGVQIGLNVALFTDLAVLVLTRNPVVAYGVIVNSVLLIAVAFVNLSRDFRNTP